MNADGSMWTKADRAIYGTGDASKLWNDLVHETMTNDGYRRNPYDKCCYNNGGWEADHCACARG